MRYSNPMARLAARNVSAVVRPDGFPVKVVSEAGDSETDIICQELPELEEIGFMGSSITDRSCEMLSRLRQLRKVSFDNSPVTAVGIATLSTLVRLTELELSAPRDVQDTIDAIGKLRQVEVLQLNNLPQSPNNVSPLLQIPLRDLIISGCHLSAECFQTIGNMENLKSLSLENTGFDAIAAREISRIAGLEKLNVANNPGCFGDSCDHIGRLKSLRTLFLDSTHIVSRDLERLNGLDKLENFSCGFSKVDDFIIEFMPPFRNLKELNLLGLELKESTVDGLNTMFPKCRISR